MGGEAAGRRAGAPWLVFVETVALDLCNMGLEGLEWRSDMIGPHILFVAEVAC